jgi:hypothetical protein
MASMENTCYFVCGDRVHSTQDKDRHGTFVRHCPEVLLGVADWDSGIRMFYPDDHLTDFFKRCVPGRDEIKDLIGYDD